MTRDIVVFGAGKIAQVASSYIATDPDVSIIGYTCDAEHVDADTFEGLPLVAFEEVAERFPPDRAEMFIALGYQDMNDLRAARLAAARDLGYRPATFVHPAVELTPDISIGAGSFITSSVVIQPRVDIGENVFVFGGAVIGHHSTIGDNCWITSHASILGVCTVGPNGFFAANATIGNGLTLGRRCFIGANALVTKDLDDGSVVVSGPSEVLRVNSDQFLRFSRFT
ncbi:MAG: acetyltransferase [Acidimicrobiia bacterium]|nr:acetyltransferase [Acidimicrobiia bacterium]